ncbi:LpqB family beta-propeller domain-containing protein [Streptacidiphilus griseoplanus]|uniref:LpqB family beta-propeller domain-containing protein n=1 Tax=Peterkaempfera griseoplana TaxID=66896 RepID=UPI0006E15833|nr:LpqB family beta-propeller domain-containing protein [Peterkaempfera griseoplana]
MRRRADRRLIAAALPLAVLLAGCAAMPDNGEVSEVNAAEHGDDQNLQVRVFPVHPQKGLDPQELLQNFLDATVGDEAGYTTAKEYLTEQEAQRWRPEAKVVVLTGNPQLRLTTTTDSRAQVTADGNSVAELDGNKTFRPEKGGFRTVFTFEKVKGEWRISHLPDGLIVNETNFSNVYERVNRYYFAAADPSGPASGRSVLVPDPIYLRRRIDPLTEAAKAVAEGPSEWLAPAVTSALDGVTVLSQQTSPDDSREVRVKVSAPDLRERHQGCLRMAVQLLSTFTDQAAGSVSRVSVLDRSGRSGCQADAQQVRAYTAVSAGGLYYQEYSSRQLMKLAGDDGSLAGTPAPADSVRVPGPLGDPHQQPRMRSVAVRRDGGLAAAVPQNGRALYEAALTPGAKLEPIPQVTSQAGPGLSEPTWDAQGDLWIADRDPAAPRVLMVRGTHAYPVTVEGLGGRTVQDLRIASDGTRIALLLADAEGARTVEMGLVRHSGTQAAPQAVISGLRPVAPQLVDVTAVSWADTDQLLVLGQEAEGVKHPQLVGVDGSHSDATTLQAPEGETRVAASEDPKSAVYADSQDHTIYRLEPNGQWRAVARNAMGPLYPG